MTTVLFPQASREEQWQTNSKEPTHIPSGSPSDSLQGISVPWLVVEEATNPSALPDVNSKGIPMRGSLKKRYVLSILNLISLPMEVKKKCRSH